MRRRRLPTCRSLALWLGALLAAGCTQTREHQARRTLPFTVRLAEVQIPASALEVPETAHASRAIPLRFDDRERVEEEILESFRRSGVFTRVLGRDDQTASSDLEVTVLISGGDFGSGSPMLGGATLSTIAWIFGGHLSWVIDDRSYGQSDVVVSVTIRRADQSDADGAAPSLYYDPVQLKDLSLSFAERAAMGEWLQNIFLPPCWGDGDPSIAGRSLADRSLDEFAARTLARIEALLPLLHFESMSTSLIYDEERRAVVVVCRKGEELKGLRIAVEGGPTRRLAKDTLSLLELDESKRDALRRSWSGLDQGLGLDSDDRWYQVPLEPQENGVVRLIGSVGGRDSRWTIRARSVGEGLPGPAVAGK